MPKNDWLTVAQGLLRMLTHQQPDSKSRSYGEPKSFSAEPFRESQEYREYQARHSAEQEFPKTRQHSKAEKEHPELFYDVQQFGKNYARPGLDLLLRGLALPSTAAESFARGQAEKLGPVLGTTGTAAMEDAWGNVAGMLPFLLTRNPEYAVAEGGGSVAARYHGSPEPIREVQPIEGVSSEGNLHGPGFYTTNASKTSDIYARTGSGSGSGVRYRIIPKNVPLYDLDRKLTADEVLDVLRPKFGDDVARAKSLAGKSIAEIQNSLNMPFGSGERISFQKYIRDWVEKQGYRGYTHIGGGGGNPHTVNIYWYPEHDLKLLPSRTPLTRLPQKAPRNVTGE